MGGKEDGGKVLGEGEREEGSEGGREEGILHVYDVSEGRHDLGWLGMRWRSGLEGEIRVGRWKVSQGRWTGNASRTRSRDIAIYT